MRYSSVKEFVNDMLDNEGILFCDNYGRRWKYENYQFYFQDIAESKFNADNISCLHLFGTEINKEVKMPSVVRIENFEYKDRTWSVNVDCDISEEQDHSPYGDGKDIQVFNGIDGFSDLTQHLLKKTDEIDQKAEYELYEALDTYIRLHPDFLNLVSDEILRLKEEM